MSENKINKNKIKIYLCDFVHNYSSAGTFTFPLNIGYVAAWAKKVFPDDFDIELFKYPGELMGRVKENIPDIVGFSNFNWNRDLSNKVSQWIKSLFPQVIILFGGPNIDYSPEKYKIFFEKQPSVDFYLPYQGETPFANLLEKIISKGMNISYLKSEPIDGVVFYDKENKVAVVGKDVPRIKEVDSIPSPYLTGLMDKFFKTNLIPIIETNRGCPYSCIYCCQGLASQHKMEFYSLERVKEELKYISQRTKNTNILLLADSNFGIVPRDEKIAEYMAELREKFGYPRVVRMNLAKNRPKIFEIAKILKNINLVLSLQSLDEAVLKNIKRENIQMPVFKDIIDKINKEGGMSGTEVILGLPGETKESHIQALKKLFDWDVSYIICYNCIVLEGSELSNMVRSGEFKCKTKFSLIDCSFGKYDGITSFESLEGIRSTPTMSENEILYFRPVHWLIQFLWNYRFYHDLLKYLQFLKINPLDYIIKIIEEADSKAPEKFKNIINEFKEEAKNEWFDSREELFDYYNQAENFKQLEDGIYGKLNGKYIFKVLMEAKEEFEEYLYETVIGMPGVDKEKAKEIIAHLSSIIIDFRKEGEAVFEDKKLPSGLLLTISEDQKQSLKILLKQYEHPNKNVTLRKMSEYMDIKDFFFKIKK